MRPFYYIKISISLLFSWNWIYARCLMLLRYDSSYHAFALAGFPCVRTANERLQSAYKYIFRRHENLYVCSVEVLLLEFDKDTVVPPFFYLIIWSILWSVQCSCVVSGLSDVRSTCTASRSQVPRPGRRYRAHISTQIKIIVLKYIQFQELEFNDVIFNKKFDKIVSLFRYF